MDLLEIYHPQVPEFLDDLARTGVMERLRQVGMDCGCEYTSFPLFHRGRPSSRWEHSLGVGLIVWHFAGDRPQAAAFYADLRVGRSERGEDELMFGEAELAADFARAALVNARVYVSDEDRFSMEYLARLLRRGLEAGVLEQADLYTTEPQVIARLEAAPETAALWSAFRAFSRSLRAAERPQGGDWFRVSAKKRYIDPYTEGRGPVPGGGGGYGALPRHAVQRLDLRGGVVYGRPAAIRPIPVPQGPMPSSARRSRPAGAMHESPALSAQIKRAAHRMRWAAPLFNFLLPAASPAAGGWTGGTPPCPRRWRGSPPPTARPGRGS